MALEIRAESAPIKVDADGAARVGGTRVLLETVIYAFLDGETPEQIVDSYDAITLADVYAVIAYYLNHREEVDQYVRHVEEEGERIRRDIEVNHPEMLRAQKRLQALKQSKS